MKSEKNKKYSPWIQLAAVGLSLASGASAYAGAGGSGGGNVLKTPSGLQVLDLVEAGVASQPLFTHDWSDAELAKQLESAFFFIPQVTTADRTALATVLGSLPKSQAYAFLAGMQAYSWNFVAGPLNRVDDVDSSLAYDPKDLVQAAVRNGYAIELRQDIWDQLDSKNRAALILHEIAYAYLTPERMTDPTTGKEYFAQSSPLARQMVGGIFALKFMDLNHYNRDGKPVTGLVPPSDRFMDDPNEIAWGVAKDSTGTPMFGYAALILIQDGEEIQKGSPGWQLSPHYVGSPGEGLNNEQAQEMQKRFLHEIAEECSAENRTLMGPVAGSIHVTGQYKVFSAQFSQVDGKSGPVIYLKPQVEKRSGWEYSPISANASEAACKTQLTQELNTAAHDLLQIYH